jgi:hypothetical protein
MEKTFQLDQKETGLLAQLDQERTQALAAVGALSLDMEQARKNLDSAAERQRGFIRQCLSSRGVEQFQNARMQNGALVVTMPEVMQPIPVQPSEGGLKMVERLNGPASDVVKE